MMLKPFGEDRGGGRGGVLLASWPALQFRPDRPVQGGGERYEKVNLAWLVGVGWLWVVWIQDGGRRASSIRGEFFEISNRRRRRITGSRSACQTSDHTPSHCVHIHTKSCIAPYLSMDVFLAKASSVGAQRGCPCEEGKPSKSLGHLSVCTRHLLALPAPSYTHTPQVVRPRLHPREEV